MLFNHPEVQADMGNMRVEWKFKLERAPWWGEKIIIIIIIIIILYSELLITNPETEDPEVIPNKRPPT